MRNGKQIIIPPHNRLPMDQLCPLCNHPFDDEDAGCRSGCPIARHCSLIRCPHCGYGFPRDSSLARWLAEAFRAVRYWLARARARGRMPALAEPGPERTLGSPPAGTASGPAGCRLTAWPREVPARVAGFTPAAGVHLLRFGAYGLTEGSILTVRRKRSAFILAIGHTDLAIDATLAQEIFVRPVTAPALPQPWIAPEPAKPAHTEPVAPSSTAAVFEPAA